MLRQFQIRGSVWLVPPMGHCPRLPGHCRCCAALLNSNELLEISARLVPRGHHAACCFLLSLENLLLFFLLLFLCYKGPYMWGLFSMSASASCILHYSTSYCICRTKVQSEVYAHTFRVFNLDFDCSVPQRISWIKQSRLRSLRRLAEESGVSSLRENFQSLVYCTFER